jgi:hypothetical protein
MLQKKLFVSYHHRDRHERYWETYYIEFTETNRKCTEYSILEIDDYIKDKLKYCDEMNCDTYDGSDYSIDEIIKMKCMN